MTNEEKSKEIARKYAPGYFITTSCCFCEQNAEDAALEMAKWKDEQFESLLHQLMVCAQQGYTLCASDEVILREMKKILKYEA